MRSLPFSSPGSRAQLLWTGVGAAWAAAAVFSFAGARLGDEWIHFEQILRFLRGDMQNVEESLTTLPGYHALVASILWLAGAESLGAARLINVAFGVLAVLAFRSARRAFSPADASLATAQFAVLPILAPYVFLAYTDVLSLALVLMGASLTLSGRHLAAALVLVAAVAVRQNNVIWVAFLALWAVLPTMRTWTTTDWTGVRRLICLWPYSLPLIAFMVYWQWNGSVSLSPGQASAHPDAKLSSANIFFGLVLVALLAPLQMVAGARRLATARWPVLLWAIPILALILYVATFEVNHPYNHLALHYNPRNFVLVATATQTWFWAAFGLVAAFGACGLAGGRLIRPEARLVLPFAALFLAASWLVETRYLLIPLSLWLALRKHESEASEYFTLAYWFALASFLVMGILSFRFMI